MEEFFLQKYTEDATAYFISGKVKDLSAVFVGDSHAFIGNRLAHCLGIKIFSGLAYHFLPNGSNTALFDAAIKLANALKHQNPDAFLVLCLGEIDCRVHLVEKARQNNGALFETVSDCVQRYCEGINALAATGVRLALLAPPLIVSEKPLNFGIPQCGTAQEVFSIQKIFCEILESYCKKSSLPYISQISLEDSENALTGLYVDSTNGHQTEHSLPRIVEQINALIGKPESTNLVKQPLFNPETGAVWIEIGSGPRRQKRLLGLDFINESRFVRFDEPFIISESGAILIESVPHTITSVISVELTIVPLTSDNVSIYCTVEFPGEVLNVRPATMVGNAINFEALLLASRRFKGAKIAVNRPIVCSSIVVRIK